MTSRTLSAAEVGAMVNQAPSTVRRRVNRGDLRYLRVGREVRFTEDQADAYIRSFTVDPDVAVVEPDDLREQTSRSRRRTA